MPEKDLVIESRIDRIVELFFNRTDTVAVLTGNGKPFPVQLPDSDWLRGILRSHLSGEPGPILSIGKKKESRAWRVGSYCPTPEASETKWLCIDIDAGPGHKAGVKDPEGTTRRILQRADAIGVKAYPFRSGGGYGVHVYVFSREPMPAKLARSLGLALIPSEVPLEEPTARGGFRYADPSKNRGIEVFPKQTKLAFAGVGNMTWSPFWAGSAANVRLEGEDLSDTSELDDIVRHEIADLEEALERASQRWTRIDKSERDRDGNARMSKWREEALGKLDLSAIYGDLLTGRVSGAAKGWLECRDPGSPSGDRDPSAGVADGTAEYMRGTYHSFISGETKSVFRYVQETGLARSPHDADALIAKLSGVPLPMGEFRTATDPGGSSKPRPQLTMSESFLHELEGAAVDALVAWNTPPQIFRRYTETVALGPSQEGPLEFHKITLHGMRSYLDQAAEWITPTTKGPKPAWPPETIARLIIEKNFHRLPPIDRIVRSPFFDRDWKLVSDPGYHREAQVWFDEARAVSLEKMPARLTASIVETAVQYLSVELMEDFDLVSAADRAHFFAALIQGFIREPLDDAATPIYLISAPKEGSGKSAIAEVISLVTLGHRIEAKTLKLDEEEQQKQIFSELLMKGTLVVFDNANPNRQLGGGPFVSAITSSQIAGRVLGTLKVATAKNRATWVVTANNPKVSGEFARRCVRIKIDTCLEKPSLRRSDCFRHPDLFGWITANRARIVRAILILILWWRKRGAPRFKEAQKVGFGDWAEITGGILAEAGIPGFLENEAELYEEVDTETDEWKEFVGVWRRRFGREGVTASALARLADAENLLPETRTAGNDRANVIRFGRALAVHKDQVFGDWRIERMGILSGTRLWRLIDNVPAAPAAAPEPAPAPAAAPVSEEPPEGRPF